MNRVELFLYALTICVRAFTTGQAMRFLGITDSRNFRRFVRPLIARGLVRSIRVFALPVPKTTEALFRSDAGDGLTKGTLARVLGLARDRCAGLTACQQTCIVATRKAGQMFGVLRSGQLRQPLQASHDLTVAECFLHLMLVGGIKPENWHSEDFTSFRLGEQRPDVVIVGPQQVPQKVLEVVGGDYLESKLLLIHQHCNALELSYELW